MADERKIESVRFQTEWGYTYVYVVLEDGTSVDQLFGFYSDELSFNKAELIGLTCDQARKLRHDKDVAYLRS